MIVIVLRAGDLESFQGRRVSLGRLTACQLQPPNQTAWGQRDISPQPQICTDMDCMSQLLLTPLVVLLGTLVPALKLSTSLYLPHTHSNIC